MPLRVVFVLASITAFSLVPVAGAKAQLIDRVAAVVNDEAISARDVENRVVLALASSQLPNTKESRQRILPQLIRKMIDERLQLQDAKRLGISLGAADVDAGVSLLEKQNRIPQGSLLKTLAAQGVDPAVIREQIRADLTWLRLIGRTVASQIRISQEEVTERLNSLLERQGTRETLVSEIFLPVDQPEQEDETRKLGEKLVEGLHNGTPFAALARQFSRSPTAANGGQMGWLSAGMVDPEIEAMITPLGKGGISPLTRTSSGYYIITVIADRIIGQSIKIEDSIVSLSELTLPVPAGGPPKNQLMVSASALTRTATSCAAFDEIAVKASIPRPTRIGPMRIAELSADLRPIAAGLTVNQVSPPQDTQASIKVYMMCSREDALTPQPPTEAAVRNQIEDERRDMLARRYMRDLRRAAFVDIRM